jgi:hypothetical protein
MLSAGSGKRKEITTPLLRPEKTLMGNANTNLLSAENPSGEEEKVKELKDTQNTD